MANLLDTFGKPVVLEINKQKYLLDVPRVKDVITLAIAARNSFEEKLNKVAKIASKELVDELSRQFMFQDDIELALNYSFTPLGIVDILYSCISSNQIKKEEIATIVANKEIKNVIIRLWGGDPDRKEVEEPTNEEEPVNIAPTDKKK